MSVSGPTADPMGLREVASLAVEALDDEEEIRPEAAAIRALCRSAEALAIAHEVLTARVVDLERRVVAVEDCR